MVMFDHREKYETRHFLKNCMKYLDSKKKRYSKFLNDLDMLSDSLSFLIDIQIK